MFAEQGGGFMTQGGGGSQGAEPKRKIQTLVPATIAMIQGASESEDGCMLGGRFASRVKIVGNILSAEAKDTRIVYTVEDGTGKIEATWWVDENDMELPTTADRRGRAQAGKYVAIIGAVKPYQGKQENYKNVIRCFDVRPVDDFNEVTYHHLEVAHCYLRSQKLVRSPPTNTESWAAGPAQAAPAAVAMDLDSNAVGSNGLKAVENAVLEYYNTNGTGDEGLQINTVINALQATIPADKIKNAIDVLVSEGFLYSTLDEEWHKSTDAY